MKTTRKLAIYRDTLNEAEVYMSQDVYGYVRISPFVEVTFDTSDKMTQLADENDSLRDSLRTAKQQIRNFEDKI